MTREDIKNVTDMVHKTICGFFDTCGDNKEVPMTDKDKLLLSVNKAICNNIKALEQESCDTCEHSDEINGSNCYECVKGIKDRYNLQEPKTGHWIMPQQDDGMSDPIYYQVRCSECGFDLDPQTWHQELHQYGADKYCPNCGANMESEENE